MNFSQLIFNNPAYRNTDIVKKCLKYPQFRKEMNKLQTAYELDLNVALYANLEEVEELGWLSHLAKDKLYVSCYGFKMPSHEELSEKLYLLWIRHLDEYLRTYADRRYVIVYFHSLTDSTYPYNFLKGIFKKLPIYYHAMLERIYVVSSTFLLRNSTLFQMGRLFKLFMRKVEYIDDVKQLAAIPEIHQARLVETLPEVLKLETEGKTFTTEPTPTPTVAPPVYQPIIKKDYLMVELINHRLGPDGQPLALSILFETLRKNPKYLEMEGIFRKSGSIEEQEDIIEQMSQLTEPKALDKIDEHSGYAIAGVVKKFFTRLLTPIVPYALYSHLLSMLSTGVRGEDEVGFVRDFLNELPVLNRKVILSLLSFLREHLVSRQQLNKMNNYNLSVCFCPCIFRAETPSLEDLLNSGKFAGIIHVMFNRYDQLFGMEQAAGRGSRGSKGSRGSRGSKNLKHKP